MKTLNPLSVSNSNKLKIVSAILLNPEKTAILVTHETYKGETVQAVAMETDEATKELFAQSAKLAGDFVEPEPPAAYIPPAVTMRQARLALLQAGLLSSVDKAIASLPSPQREAATIEWEYSSEVKRGGDLVTQLGAALGLSDDEMDKLFKTAAAL